MLTSKSIDARLRALRSLEARCGPRPDITADIKSLTAERRRMAVEEASKPSDDEPAEPEDEC